MSFQQRDLNPSQAHLAVVPLQPDVLPQLRAPRPSMDQRIDRVIAYMTENLHRKLTLTDLAKQVNLSGSHLRKLFRTEIGRPPMVHLKMLQVERAQVLLKTTFLSVKEVMAHVGVFDKSHFLRDFRRFAGMTPTEYRRRYRK
jgi:AraC family transcriptional regulator